jgi:hypothetical protein
MVAMRARPHMGTNCFLVSAGISWKKIHAYLNEEVRDQRSEERSNGNINVLGEDNALRLDDEKVDKLLDIVQETLQGRLGDSEVLARPELGCDTLSKSGLSSDLCRSSTAKHDPSRLENVADDVEVTGGEDEDDSGGERNTGCAGVLPAQEAVEHAVVVYHRLAKPRTRRHPQLYLRVRFWPVAVFCSGICLELARSANSSRVLAPSAFACWATGPTKSVFGLSGGFWTSVPRNHVSTRLRTVWVDNVGAALTIPLRTVSFAFCTEGWFWIEAMVFCAAVRSLGEEIKVVCGAPITLS